MTFAIEDLCCLLPISQMRPHEAFPKLAMVGDGEVKELMNDDIVPDVLFVAEKLGIEVEVSIGRAGGPFGGHGADAQPDDLYFQFLCPTADALFKGSFPFGFCADEEGFDFSRIFIIPSTIPEASSISSSSAMMA